jgi:hypothetical protein
MQEIKKLLTLTKHEYYETHLSIINCIIPEKLTPTEIKVLAAFMALEGDIAQYRFGPSAKKIIMKELGLKPAGLSNYMTALKNKSFLLESENGVINILPILLPEKEEQFYRFKLVNSNQ